MPHWALVIHLLPSLPSWMLPPPSDCSSVGILLRRRPPFLFQALLVLIVVIFVVVDFSSPWHRWPGFETSKQLSWLKIVGSIKCVAAFFLEDESRKQGHISDN